jgi:hypothetical protein
MSAEKAPELDQQQYVPPRIRCAPCGELRIYTIHESELDELARGSPASTELNLAIAFLSVGVSLLAALLTTPRPAIYIFTVLVVIVVATIIAGVVLIVLWARSRKSSKKLADTIKGRMPPEPGIQEPINNGTQSPDRPVG